MIKNILLKIKNLPVYFIYVFAGFTGVFRYWEWMPIYQYGVVVSFLFASGSRWYYSKEDILLLVCFIVLFISSFISFNDKTINYILAYLYLFFVLYKSVDMLSRSIALESLLKFNAIGVLVSSFYSCLEFFLKLFLNIEIQDMLPRVKQATATYMVGIDRSYGFATEPTSLAFYLNILGPFALIYWRNNLSRLKFLVYTAILILGWAFTFSAAAFLFMLLSICVSLLGYYRLKIVRFIIDYKLGLAIFSGVIIYLVNSGFLDKIIGKIFLSEEGTSSGQRLMVFELAVGRFLENPLAGIGLGYTSSVDEMSPMNWYLIILSNGGVFAFMLIFSYMILIMKKAFHITDGFTLLPAVGILSGVLGFLTT